MEPTLQIIPEILEFHPPYSRVITNTIKLTNTSQERWVCFKVKTTSPKRYNVRPSIAVIPPMETYSVQVTLNLNKEPVEENGKDRDRFQILCIFVPTTIDPKAFDPKNMWNELPQDQIMKYRLKTSRFTTSTSSSRPSETHHQDEEGRGERSGSEWAENEAKLDYARPPVELQSTHQTTSEAHPETSLTEPNLSESPTVSPYSTPSSSTMEPPYLPSSQAHQQQTNEKDDRLTSKIDELAAKYKRSGVEVGGNLTLRQRAAANNGTNKDTERVKSERPQTSSSFSPSSSNALTSLQNLTTQNFSFQTVVIIALLSFLLGHFFKSCA